MAPTRRVSISELKKIEKIGEGTYGIVYKAQDRSGNFFALKKIRTDHDEEGVPSTSLREIALLKEMRHPYVVDLLAVEADVGRLNLVFEFIPLDMREWMKGLGRKSLKPSADETRRISFQLVNALAYMHQRRCIHRDLKPSNMLIDPNSLRIKVCDMGLARVVGLPVRAYTHEIVTLWYRSPEVLMNSQRYSYGVDIWSVACMIVELSNGKALFTGDSEIDQLYKIFRVLTTPTEATWPGVSELPEYRDIFPNWRVDQLDKYVTNLDANGVDLVRQMFVYVPNNRIQMKDAFYHPYFRETDTNGLPLTDLVAPSDLTFQR